MIKFACLTFICFLLHSSNGVQILHGVGDYTSYHVGNMNLVISVPHNGLKTTSDIPDRHNGCLDQNNNCIYTHNCGQQSNSCSVRTAGDSYTKSIATKFYDKVHELTGLYPHMIVSELRRKKMDPNREVNEATFGDPLATQVYNDFHNFINQAKNAISGDGLLIDMHGQTHPEEWIELGYLISRYQLVNNIWIPSISSIRALDSRFNNVGLENLVRGPNSLGKLLNDHSQLVVPSPNNPDPTASGNYYSGGFIVKTYGSKNGGNIDAIQVEAPKNIRFSSTKRTKFGQDLGSAVVSFMQTYYGLL
ncbi:DgyrCDS13244 [Dimorphilus gyrociliatus]|uniref:DgyrCDS13244 n=1 Tax=Dimorphilus gyrociliatus TaxID=2664684 RepID=A0A7I8WA68_9ANNE|nr:DgyrCDS13244 [Dimorphilus gyrociliatus]